MAIHIELYRGSMEKPGPAPQPAVVERIIDMWGSMKHPALVTFVVATSGSLEGEPLAEVKEGLTRMLDVITRTAGAGGSRALYDAADVDNDTVDS